MDINQDIMQHLTGDQFNGETALSVANFARYINVWLSIEWLFIDKIYDELSEFLKIL